MPPSRLTRAERTALILLLALVAAASAWRWRAYLAAGEASRLGLPGVPGAPARN